MAVDVSPEILEEIEKNFEEYYKDPNVKRIYKKIVDGTATYSDMQILSSLVAKHIYQSTEKAYTNALDSGKLPNDKLYQNIVDKTMRPTLKDGHGLIVEACGDVQTDLNRKSGIKLNAVEPELNESKVSGLIYQVTNTNETRLSRTVLSGLIDTFCRSIVDDFVHANLDFQKESGLSPQISRTRGANSNSKCEYCAALVYTGEYKGPGMPAEIFRRHRYCHCNVLYNPMNGKKLQDVWSKREYQDYHEAEQRQRQYLAELDKMTPTERRLARNARARELRRAKYTPQEWERRKALEAEIAEGKGLSKALPLEERRVYRGFSAGTPASGITAQKRMAAANKTIGNSVAKNVEMPFEFERSRIISQDIKDEIKTVISNAQKNYRIVIGEIVYKDISKQGNIPFQFHPTQKDGKYFTQLIINSGYDWNDTLEQFNTRIYNKNYLMGLLASRNTSDLIMHEMAHFMTFQDCKTWGEYVKKEKKVRKKFIHGISKYNNSKHDGAETIAEGFVAIHNGESISPEIRKLVEYYVEGNKYE